MGIMLSSYVTPGINKTELNKRMNDYSVEAQNDLTIKYWKPRPAIWMCTENERSRNDDDYHVFRIEEITNRSAALITIFQDPVAIKFLDFYGTDFRHSETEIPQLHLLVSQDVSLNPLFPTPGFGLSHSKNYSVPVEERLMRTGRIR